MSDMNHTYLHDLREGLEQKLRERLDEVIDTIVRTKEKGGKIVVVTGSGPNIHEGVTTLLAELVSRGVVDGIVTSSAVVAHEMAGSLDRVKRVDGRSIGIDAELLPRGDLFEVTLLDEESIALIREEMSVDTALMDRVLDMPGDTIIKAAGNMAYPMGLRTERLAVEVQSLAQCCGETFEYIAGLGADAKTMIGAGARKRVPVVVSVPQLIGGGMVGLCIGDSISFKQRSTLIATMLSGASVIIESGIALSQEIHDGPFETYTGHGIWSAWGGHGTFSLKDKVLVRIDLDPNLEKVWEVEKLDGEVQRSVDQGLPKTKTFKVPFRMEMSGFARLEGSIPLIGDLGVIWPLIAEEVSDRLKLNLGFISYPQENENGKEMRNWSEENVGIVDRHQMIRQARSLMSWFGPMREEGV